MQGVAGEVAKYPTASIVIGFLGVLLGPAGAVWAVFKFRLNGLVDDLKMCVETQRQFEKDAVGSLSEIRDVIVRQSSKLELHERFIGDCSETLKKVALSVQENREALIAIEARIPWDGKDRRTE